MSVIRIVVTGAGSIVGQGIIKALRISNLPVCIIATDIAPLNVGLFRADEAVILPAVESPGALERIIDEIRRINAQVLMIGSEFDLLFYSQNRALIERETGTLIIVSPRHVVDIADDKLRTAEFLKLRGISYAPATEASSLPVAVEWATVNGYPLVLKTRSGTSARHVHIVEDEAELLHLLPKVPNPMLQRLAGPITAGLGYEYTCSIFQCADGTILGPIICRRTLKGGSSWLVEVAPEPAAEALMRSIAAVVPSVGCLNVQLMVVDGKAVPFELNARFSGTTPIRAYFGFNEPEFAVRSYLLGEKVPPPQIRRGVCARYVEEIFIDDVIADQIHAPFPKGRTMNWF